jgi:hypothetical protein
MKNLLEVGDIINSERILEGKYNYQVLFTQKSGGGTGHGPNDVYPDGHQVILINNELEEDNNLFYFYQTGSFVSSVMISPEEIELVAVSESVSIPRGFKPSQATSLDDYIFKMSEKKEYYIINAINQLRGEGFNKKKIKIKDLKPEYGIQYDYDNEYKIDTGVSIDYILKLLIDNKSKFIGDTSYKTDFNIHKITESVVKTTQENTATLTLKNRRNN